MFDENKIVTETSVAERPRDRVDKYIYRQLMLLKAGGKLPSIRAIMRECGASQLIVQSVLRDYENRDMIRSSDRRGMFKVGSSPDDNKIFEELDLIYCTPAKDQDPMTKFHGELSFLLGRMCGENWRSIRTHFLEAHGDLQDFKQLARNSTCRACIIVGSADHTIGKIMNSYNVAYVNLLPESAQLDPNGVNIIIDNEKVISQQLDHLTELGHRKIGYIHCLRDNETIRDLLLRREAFFRQVVERGLEIKSNWIQFGGYDSETCFEAMTNIMSSDDKPTAVIAYDHQIPAIYHYLAKNHMEPGLDFSVLGTDNLPISTLMSPNVSSLDISRKEAAGKAIKALEKIISGKNVNNVIYLKTKVIPRQSTGKI